MGLTTVLLDLDGVLRHFDPARVRAVEDRYGLAAGVLHAAAFEPELLEPVVTGRVRRADWVLEIGRRVGHPVAARECFADIGVVDGAMVREVDLLRSRGVRVAVLTNGTDTIPDELSALGLVSHLDAVFNSADLGVAKPDRRAFEAACSGLGVDPHEVLFTDDSPAKLAGATAIGMTAHVFVGVEAFRSHLVAAGLRNPDDHDGHRT